MNCFRKTKEKGEFEQKPEKFGQKKKGKKCKEIEVEVIADEKDGHRFSRTLIISSTEKSTSCWKETDAKGTAELRQFAHYESDERKYYCESSPDTLKSCNPVVAYLPVSKDDPFYNMNHPKRGKAIIFNFDRWDNTTIPDLELTPRKGSEKDRNDLAECLLNLDFDVESYDNCGNLEMWDILEKLRREDHSDKDCLLVAVMTHGERNTVYMRDGTQIPVNLIWENFEANRCPTLAGKPKIFIIQACRGKKYDSGTKLIRTNLTPSDDISLDETDSATFSYVIPNAADIIVAFSCPLGHYSWRNPENGSWFIQAICKVFKNHAYELDLQGLLTTVAREVALNYQSNTTLWESHKKKQVTSTSSTLIRTILFAPKSKLGSSSVPSGEFMFEPRLDDKTEIEEEMDASQIQSYL